PAGVRVDRGGQKITCRSEAVGAVIRDDVLDVLQVVDASAVRRFDGAAFGAVAGGLRRVVLGLAAAGSSTQLQIDGGADSGGVVRLRLVQNQVGGRRDVRRVERSGLARSQG